MKKLMMALALLPLMAAAEVQFSFEQNGDGTISLTGINGAMPADLLVPSRYDGREVTSVGDGFAKDASALRSVTISEGILSVGSKAFSGCGNLQGVSLPASLTTIYDRAFTVDGLIALEGKCQLQHISVAPGNRCFRMDGPVLIDLNARSAILVQRDASEVSLPDGVETIERRCFSGCGKLTKVIGGRGLRRISEEAFLFCRKLTTVQLMDTRIESVRKKAFSGCESLESIEFPDSLSELSAHTFRWCNRLTKCIIHGNAPTVVLEQEEDGWGVAKDYVYVTSNANLDDPSTWNDYYSGARVLGSVVTYVDPEAYGWGDVPGTWQGVPVAYAPGAVRYRTEPNYLDGGITLTGIASGTPSGTLYIPSTYSGQTVTAVGDNFYQLGGITKVVFPSTVKRIVDCGFEDCPNLQEVELNEGLEEIGGWVFNDCDKIKKIVIPSTVRSIGDSSFNINGLESIDVAGGNDWYYAENGFLIEKAACRTVACISVRNGRGVSLAVPQGVLVIGRDTFRKSKCTALSFPSSVRGIETLGVLAPDSTIREIDLSICKNLTSIGAGGFMAAQQLTKVNFPASLVSIGRFAFGGCAALQEVTFLGRRVSIPEELDGELEEYLKTLASGAINPERGGDLYVTRDGKPLPNVTTYVLPGMGWENEIRAGKWQGCPLIRAPGYGECRFDGNGSPDSMPSIATKTGLVCKLPKCTLRSPSDMLHFGGWACSNGKRYDDEMLVFGLGDVTMTAIWE